MNPFRTAVLAALAFSRVAAAQGASTVLEGVAQVPPGQDACLDLSVRELGMSAKRVDSERRWVIGPQYLHPSVKSGGTFGVRFEKRDRATAILVTATWPGDRKPDDVEPEIEQRMVAMVRKLAQICGVVKADVKCTITESPGKTTACAPVP
jgi:hypothetical protein